SVWIWIGILRFYSTEPGGGASSLPGEVLAIMTFLTVYSMTEITFSFYSVGWMCMAPLFAHVRLRAYQSGEKRQPVRISLSPIRDPCMTTSCRRDEKGALRRNL